MGSAEEEEGEAKKIETKFETKNREERKESFLSIPQHNGVRTRHRGTNTRSVPPRYADSFIFRHPRISISQIMPYNLLLTGYRSNTDREVVVDRLRRSEREKHRPYRAYCPLPSKPSYLYGVILYLIVHGVLRDILMLPNGTQCTETHPLGRLHRIYPREPPVHPRYNFRVSDCRWLPPFQATVLQCHAPSFYRFSLLFGSKALAPWNRRGLLGGRVSFRPARRVADAVLKSRGGTFSNNFAT